MRKYILTVICLLLVGIGTASAKRQQVGKMYMFGMAAAFTDTIVHFTNIQAVDSVWIDTKNDFLEERKAYSYQLRDFLNQKQQMPNRTCIVFYAQKREKLEKKYLKLKNLYTKGKDGKQHFDVRYIPDSDFMFTTVKSVIDDEQ